MLSKCCCFWKKKKETLLEKKVASQWHEIAELEEKLDALETKITHARDNILLDKKQEDRVLEISDVLDKLGKEGVTITVAKLKEHVKTVPHCGPATQMQLLLLFEDCCMRNEYLYERKQVYQEWKEGERMGNERTEVREEAKHGQSLSMQGNVYN